MIALPPKRMAAEAAPIAVSLLFWNLLAGIAQFQNVGGPVASAGVVMAALYVAVRGVSLSTETLPPAVGDVKTVLYENATLAVPAGAWFVPAMVVGAIEAHVHEFTWIISSVKTALAGAGLGVVALYAVAAGYRTLDGASRADDGTATSDGTGADGTASDD